MRQQQKTATPGAHEDRTLVGRAVSGDASAFERLFEKYRNAMYNIAWRYTGNQETALDLAQETFVRAYEKLATFRRDSNFYTWLRRIATNLCIDHLRAKSSNTRSFDEHFHADSLRRVPGVPSPPAPDVRAEQKEFTEALWPAVEKLSEKQRAVFLLHAVEEMSYKEIAATLGCSMGTVMSRLHYARRNLQEMLQAHLD